MPENVAGAGVLAGMAEAGGAGVSELGSSLVAALAFLVGLGLAYALYVRRRPVVDALAANPVGGALRRWWFADWGMDWLYDRLFVRPVVWIAHVDRHDVVDTVFTGIARAAEAGHAGLSGTETGRLRWYAAGIAAGSVLFVAIVLFL